MRIASRSTALVVLVVRYGLERAAVRHYPERLAVATFVPNGKPGWQQQIGSTLAKASMFVFVIVPYIGMRWQLWLVVALSVGPSLAGIAKDGFPNSTLLYRLAPRGVPNTLVMMIVGAALGSLVAARVDDPTDLLVTSFVILSIPGFALAVVGLFAREGIDPATGWAMRIAGVWVVTVTVLKVVGWLGDSVWLPLALVAPVLIWWFVATERARCRSVEDDATTTVTVEAEAVGVDADDVRVEPERRPTSVVQPPTIATTPA